MDVNTTLTNQHGPIINLSGEKKPCMVGLWVLNATINNTSVIFEQ
jgi:hypothetical protein